MNLLQLLYLVIAVSPSPGPAQPVTVTVKAKPEVAGPRFTIGDIADVTGKDKALVAAVSAAGNWASPLPGLGRTLYRSDMLIQLRASRVDPVLVELVCPESIAVSRGGIEVPADDLVKAAVDAVRSSRTAGDDDTLIEATRNPVKLIVAPGKLELKADQVRAVPVIGQTMVPVEVYVDGKRAATIAVAIRIRRVVKAVVAKRALDAKTVLSEDDLAIGQVDATPGAAAPIADLQAFLGKRLSRRFAQGQAIPESAIEKIALVAPGAKIELEVVVGAIRIVSPAVARTGGGIGERIRVYATETKREMTAVVVDSGVVRAEEIP